MLFRLRIIKFKPILQPRSQGTERKEGPGNEVANLTLQVQCMLCG